MEYFFKLHIVNNYFINFLLPGLKNGTCLYLLLEVIIIIIIYDNYLFSSYLDLKKTKNVIFHEHLLTQLTE